MSLNCSQPGDWTFMDSFCQKIIADLQTFYVKIINNKNIKKVLHQYKQTRLCC